MNVKEIPVGSRHGLFIQTTFTTKSYLYLSIDFRAVQ